MTTKVGLYRDKRSKNRPWLVRWFGEYDPDAEKQRHYFKSFARKRDAETFQAAKQAELDRGGTRDRPKDITMSEFAERFLESRIKNRRPATRNSYQFTLEQLIAFVGADMPVRLVSRELADRFVASRKRIAKTGSGFSSWSRKRYLANAKAAFKVLVEWGYLTENPFDHVKVGRCVARKWHHLTPEEFQALLTATEDRRWQVFYLLAYTTGARFGELFNLTWADVDFERQTITVRSRPATATIPPFQVKDHETRTLLLPRQTVEALLAWQAEAPEGVPYVLLTAERWALVQAKWRLCRAGKPWKKNGKTSEQEWAEWENRYMVNNVLRDMRGHLRKAGVLTEVPLTVHTLRKSFGQNHANAGTPIHVLQTLMGHASITTTREFYLQIADANERDALRRYEALIAPQKSDETCVRIAYEGVTQREGQKATSVTSHQEKT